MLAPFALRGHTAPLLLRIARHVLLVLRELLRLLLAQASVPALLAALAPSLSILVLQLAPIALRVTSVLLRLPRVRPATPGPLVNSPLHAPLKPLPVTIVPRAFGLLRVLIPALPAWPVTKESTI